MRIRQFVLDAFTDHVFGGNPAAVCLLESWLPAETMQAIAAENNLSETAFCVPDAAGYGIRWFTPRLEIALAGHPTLATAWVILNEVHPDAREVVFTSRKGDVLSVVRDGLKLIMDFPAVPATPNDDMTEIANALGAMPEAFLRARDDMAVFGSEAEIRALEPDMARVAAIDTFGVIATAPGDDCDFVSRFFAPRAGIPEDPVTGSAHCTLTPYWSERLGKKRMQARQISERGGQLDCEHVGDRVRLGGSVVPFMEGHITI